MSESSSESRDQAYPQAMSNPDDPFGSGERLPDVLPDDPLPLVKAWLDEAIRDRVQRHPNTMMLATADAHGNPKLRTLLCKHLDARLGYVVFYTNYHSRKAGELTDRPRAAALFHWDALERQIRLEGSVVPSPPAESDAYFASRPWESRIGAWASDQSQPIESHNALLERVIETMARFGVDIGAVFSGEVDVEIPRPPFWGGYRLWIERVELWVSGNGRIHDRAEWTRTLRRSGGDEFAGSAWSSTRLQP